MKKSERIISLTVFFIILITEVIIAKFAHGWIRNSFGDVLVMPAMYFLIRIFTQNFRKTLPFILFIFACFVELLQYFDICGILGIPKGSILSIIIGTTGLWSDVLYYAAGTALIYAGIILKNKLCKISVNTETIKET